MESHNGLDTIVSRWLNDYAKERHHQRQLSVEVRKQFILLMALTDKRDSHFPITQIFHYSTPLSVPDSSTPHRKYSRLSSIFADA